MKKDTHQPTCEPTDEPKTTSTVLTLQQLNKEVEKKEAAAESAKVRCRICFKETAPTPRCFGHGGGGGGGGSGSGHPSEDKASQGDDKSLLKGEPLVDDTEEWIGMYSSMEGSEGLDSESDEGNFDPEVIAELVAQGLLMINNNRESMTLTCGAESLSEAQREELNKFMEAIVKEFNAFKEQHSLSHDCIHMIQDEEGNILSLRIRLPTLALYDAFINRLANNLLPIPNPTLQTKEELQKTKNSAPAPLSMEPKPSDNSKHLIQDEAKQNEKIPAREIETADEEREAVSPSPFLSKITPW